MSEVIVHQALHGYNDGHRLIASSMPLGGAEARLMLVMSDLSGHGLKPPETGYLTGYALEKAGKYVLARTWSAPEMARPGCVWTHSLIIDNADLAQIRSPTGLMQAFMKPPQGSQRASYSASLTVSLDASALKPPNRIRVHQLVNALYGRTDSAVLFPASEPSDDEALILELWMQQWPRLRRSFGFCTLSGSDRSIKGAALDLQFVRQNDRTLQSQGVNFEAQERPGQDCDLELLVDDIMMSGGRDVREFLRRVGGDVSGGRKAMAPLCRLYRSLLEPGRPDLAGAVEAFAELDAHGTRQARSLRMLIVREAARSASAINDEVVDFLFDALATMVEPAQRSELASQLAPVLWRNAPERLVQALRPEHVLSDFAQQAIASIPSIDLLFGLKKRPALISEMVSCRPDLLLVSDLWQLPDATDDFVEAVDHADMARLALALLSAGRTNPARFVIQHLDAGALIQVFEQSGALDEVLKEWVAALSEDPNKAAGVLASGRMVRPKLLVELACRLHPDAIPNDFGEDPWAIAMSAIVDPIELKDRVFLFGYIMVRALGRRSNSPAELLRQSYTTVYQALLDGSLPTQIESMLLPRLRWGTWLDWDSCSRLRETVTHRFVEDHLDPHIFGTLTDDGKLALSLIDEAARSGRGRRYLRDVRSSLQGASQSFLKVRAEHIARKLIK